MDDLAPTTPYGTALIPGVQDFPAHLAGLRARLSGLAAAGLDGDESLEVVADLETAYEELRVADEEVRSQHDEISRLLVSRDDLQRHHDRMLSALPVPAVVTDDDGIIRAVNAAAASLVGVGVARLLGKPVFVFFGPEHRRDLRSLLGRSRAAPTLARAVLVRRAGDPVEVSVTLVDSPEASQVHTWLLLPLETSSSTDLVRIPAALTELAGLPALGLELQDVLNRAAAVCLRALGDLDLSITVGNPIGPDALASTSVLAQAVDGAQITAAEGPCVSAFAERTSIVSVDVATDPRWPALSRLLPVAPLSAIAAPIEVGQRLVGALNVYSPRSLERWVEEATDLLAATLGAVFYELELNSELADLNRHMERALASRASIEQAKGIIMGQRGCSADEAFAHLRELSSRQERKLRDVAQLVVDQATGPR